MRIFLIEWYDKKAKYNKVVRHSTFYINNPIGDIGVDCHRAVNQFCDVYGGLHKNEIIYIQELDNDGNPIGVKIIPQEDSSIVPMQTISKAN